MEPVTMITTAIVAALSAGAAAGVKDAATKAVADGYTALKSAIAKRFGEKSAVANAVEQLEAKPDSQGRQLTLGEEVEAAGVDDAPELLEVARTLLETLEAQPGGEQHIHQVAKGIGIAQVVGSGTATVSGVTVKGDPPADG